MRYLDRRHYRLLTAIAAHGRLGLAAAALGLSQPAASHQLREAERRLGVRLVARSGRQLTLTDAARRLAESAGRVEEMLERAESDAVWLDRNGLASLRLAVGVYDLVPWLPGASRRLAAAHGGMPVDVVRVPQDDVEAAIASDRADAALMPGPEPPPALAAETLFADPLVAVLAPEDRRAAEPALAADAFRDGPYLTYQLRPTSGFEAERFFGPAETAPARILRLESVAAMVEMIAAGLGASILPAWAVAGAEAAGRVTTRPLAPAPLTTTWRLWIGPHRPPAVAAALATLRDGLIADAGPAVTVGAGP